jgi:hypothetical protein
LIFHRTLKRNYYKYQIFILLYMSGYIITCNISNILCVKYCVNCELSSTAWKLYSKSWKLNKYRKETTIEQKNKRTQITNETTTFLKVLKCLDLKLNTIYSMSTPQPNHVLELYWL